MTKFDPSSKTWGEALGPAMTITDEEEAQQYLADYAADIQKRLDVIPDQQGRTAMQLAQHNLGYYAGYYDEETRRRVERLFACAHPMFGPIAQGAPTPEQAFAAGVKWSESKKA